MPEIPFSPVRPDGKKGPPVVNQEASKAPKDNPPAQVSPELAAYFAQMDPKHTQMILEALNDKKSKIPLGTEDDFFNFVELVTGKPIPGRVKLTHDQTPSIPPPVHAGPPLPLEGASRQLRPMART